MQIVPSTFRLPVLAKTPIVMVAAGTGIAPFRGFIQERARVASTAREVGKTLLFFGCRSPENDYLYQDELEDLATGPLKDILHLHTAFSRTGSEKKYVQHRIQDRTIALVTPWDMT